tara:strand:+ start:621 stop:968 length:348 start_codon:yes stop_codon:yes gene_type:complete
MVVKIKNLRLRTVIGINEEEQNKIQEILINIQIQIDGEKASQSDAIEDTVNYKKLRNEIIDHVEGRKFQLIEKIAADIAKIVMSHPLPQSVSVEVDKPHALRLSESVSATVELFR